MSTRQWQIVQVFDTLIPAAYSGWTPWGCFPVLKVGQMIWPIVNGLRLYVDRPARVVSTNPITTRTLE